jgi:hypothetical protein
MKRIAAARQLMSFCRRFETSKELVQFVPRKGCQIGLCEYLFGYPPGLFVIAAVKPEGCGAHGGVAKGAWIIRQHLSQSLFLECSKPSRTRYARTQVPHGVRALQHCSRGPRWDHEILTRSSYEKRS